MKNLSFLIVFVFIILGCRADIEVEQKVENSISPNSFRKVDRRDIPDIMSALSRKATDFKVPLNSISNAFRGQNETIFGDINSDYIIESVVDGQAYYVFSIIPDQDYNGSEIYNMEVMENGGHEPSMKIVVYIPTEEWVVSANGDFTVFSGSVNTYSLDGNLESSVVYDRGVSTCTPPEPCPDCPTNPHGPGSGTGSGSGSGGGGNPPGNGPGGPWNPGGGYGGGTSGSGSSGGGSPSCGWVAIMNDDEVVGAYNTCTGQVVYFMTRPTGSLRVPCSGSGSGVVINPYTPAMYLADHLNFLGFPLSASERLFINNPANSAIARGLRNYLYSNNNSSAAIFVKWSISFFMFNSLNNVSTISWDYYYNLFLTDIPDGFIQQIISQNPTTVLNYETLDSPDFKMRKIDKVKYPKFTNTVINIANYVNSNPNVMQTLKQFTGMNDQQVLNALKFGQGPLLEIVDLPGAYGYHNPLTNTIQIDINYVKKLENSIGANAEIMNLFLSITLLHEFIHWTDGLFFNWTQESGESWEIATYGFIVDMGNVKLIKN